MNINPLIMLNISSILMLLIAVAILIFLSMKLQPSKKSGVKLLAARASLSMLATMFIICGFVRLAVIHIPYLLQSTGGAMQEKQTKSKSKAAKHITDENAIIVGNLEAKNTIIVFTDPLCGYCVKLHHELVEVAKLKDVKLAFKQLAFQGPASQTLVKYSLAVYLENDLKKTEKFLEIISGQEFLTKYRKAFAADAKNIDTFFSTYIKEAGLDTAKIKKGLKSSKINKMIAEVNVEARTLGVRGTPYMIINGKVNPGYLPADRILDML
ncbi:MAG: thioredoxin domain-containing protein [Alphaproteobacteria bacterium]|nr:thioredoxin domain-containing protein [Alphaproteobacteria bacterium]MBL0718222.1 thioredoxin domain-containing protein [Alphaproteobacteria bacterium]